MDIRDVFENKIKIESKVMSIESLFNNKTRVRNTDFKPSYQRNYVWDDEKASYFIESILLGTENTTISFSLETVTRLKLLTDVSDIRLF